MPPCHCRGRCRKGGVSSLATHHATTRAFCRSPRRGRASIRVSVDDWRLRDIRYRPAKSIENADANRHLSMIPRSRRNIVMVLVVHDAVREAELEQLLKGFLRPGRLYIDVLRGLYIEVSLLRVPYYLGPKGLSLFRGGFF